VLFIVLVAFTRNSWEHSEKSIPRSTQFIWNMFEGPGVLDSSAVKQLLA
jgi:hypothetical protein